MSHAEHHILLEKFAILTGGKTAVMCAFATLVVACPLKRLAMKAARPNLCAMGDADASNSASEARDRLVAALARVARQDQSAMRLVYELTSMKLFGICLRISGDRESAEDILQDVYIKVWNRAGRFDAGRASPMTWLCAITRNSAIDWKRTTGRAMFLPEAAAADIADDRPQADDMMVTGQERDRVHECLDALEVHTRTSIRAAFFDGLTYAELAEQAKVPLGTMKSWVRRGLLRLKACIGDG